MRAALAVSFVAALVCGAAAQKVPAPERFAAARRALEALVEDNSVPSVAIAVLEGSEIVWAEGFGLADRAKEIPATADTIYRLASISKPFTATAIMQLVERGLVDLDAPVNRYLDVPLRAYRGTTDAITVRRLLNHTGGLPTHWNFFFGDEQPPPRGESIRTYGFAAFEPGTRTNYSNLAFGVLDHVVARIGRHADGFRGWLVEELLDPLGMTHTDVGVRPGKEQHAAVGYRKVLAWWKAIPDYGFDHDGASAVWSSANDLMRFARLQLEKGEVAGRRILSEKATLAMRERRGQQAGSSFGIGWAVGEARGEPVIRHSGGMPGVSTQLLVFPRRNAAVAVLNNGGVPRDMQRAFSLALDALVGGEKPTADAAPRPPVPPMPLPGRFRGQIAGPEGPVPVHLAFNGRRAEVTVGTNAPAEVGVTLGTAGPRLRCRRPLPLGGMRSATALTFDLQAGGRGISGVCYATIPGICNLPLWCELVRQSPKPANTLRVVTYNVLVGFRDSEVGRFLPGCRREATIAAWLAAQQPDVVALQEMNGYTEDSLRRLAAAWGHEHTALLKKDGYPVAITSSTPLTNVARLREGLHHGMLRATTHGTDFVVVHFRPHPGVEFKLGECQKALAFYREALAAGRQAIVLGDFNSIHPDDAGDFSKAARTRYDKWRYLTTDDTPAEVAITPLLDAGAVDILRAVGTLPPKWPLPRIDFVLASPDLAARATGSRWLCDDERLRWSDHPPAVADFAIRGGEPNRK